MVIISACCVLLCVTNLQQQLVLGEALDWFQKVRIKAQLVLQFLLALLQRVLTGLKSGFCSAKGTRK